MLHVIERRNGREKCFRSLLTGAYLVSDAGGGRSGDQNPTQDRSVTKNARNAIERFQNLKLVYSK